MSSYVDVNTVRSQTLFSQAQQYIPGGVNSPVRSFRSVGGTPRFIARAQGAIIEDVDGNRYIDYVGSWGPMILGHAHPDVISAVQQAATSGLSFGAPCEAETTLAQMICERVPSVDKVRFASSGTEATMTAVRLARGVTGRDKIIKFEGCYHGASDSLLVKAGSGALTLGVPSSPGVPEAVAAHTLVADFNDLDSVANLFNQHPGQIAAIIVEPIAGNMNLVLPRPEFLTGLRELCDRYQALLIFDEVMTGFRVARAGAQSLYPIRPDITTFGKIIGGGMPVGAIGGRSDIMDQLAPLGSIYQAGTLSGNPVAMAAGIATLRALDQPNSYTRLQGMTQYLISGLDQRATEAGIDFNASYVCGMFGLYFTAQEKIERFQHVTACNQVRFRQFFHGMLANGVYLAPSPFEAGFISLAHDHSLVNQTLDVAEQVFADMARD